jgi:hypothetical protein
LEEILSKAKEYCRRLENAALDFVCIEEATEIINHSKDIDTDRLRVDPEEIVKSRSMIPIPWGAVEKNSYIYDYQFVGKGSQSRSAISVPWKPFEKNSYIYDYQLVRKGSQKIERRILVKKNGKKMHIENAPPMTSAFRVTNVLFGPVSLLGPARQSRYEFRIIGEEKVEGQNSYILETSPRFVEDQHHCFGRIWVKEDDSSILKIEWDQRSLGGYNLVEDIAKKYNAEPRVTSITEYGLEKNGIRFPSRDTSEEAYIMQNGKKFVRSTTTILYKDYKFFTVETEVKY